MRSLAQQALSFATENPTHFTVLVDLLLYHGPLSGLINRLGSLKIKVDGDALEADAVFTEIKTTLGNPSSSEVPSKPLAKPTAKQADEKDTPETPT